MKTTKTTNKSAVGGRGSTHVRGGAQVHAKLDALRKQAAAPKAKIQLREMRKEIRRLAKEVAAAGQTVTHRSDRRSRVDQLGARALTATRLFVL